MFPTTADGRDVHRWRRAIQTLWNAPNTALGLLGGLGGTYTVRRTDGTAEVVGGWFVGLLARFRLADAITLGDVILYADASLPSALRGHEMVHVRQYRLWGPFFLAAYLLESLYQWLRTGDGYRQNRFEKEAYEDKK